MRLLLAMLLIPALISAPAFAQDRDADGIPDDVEVQLGTNPDLDEGLQLVTEDKLRGAGDTSGRGPNCPDVDQIYFAHVAGDRYVWKVTFAQQYPEKGTIFHLYTDIDDDKSTGRQDKSFVRGVDMMYSMVDARPSVRFNNPAVRVSPAMPVRQVIRGNAIYVSDDVHMNVADGKTHFRMWVLSQLTDPQSDSDSTAEVYVDAPLHPDRALPKLPYPEPEGFEAITLPDFAQLMYNIWQDERTVRLRPKDAAVAGYTLLMNDDFDGTGERVESATWECPVEGEYLIGLVLRDEPGRLEGLDVLVAGRKVGTLVGSGSSRQEVLHFTDAPVALTKGQSIQVRTAEKGGRMRFHSVCLLAERPEVPQLVIEDISAWHIPDEPGQRPGRIMIAWTTNRPTDAGLNYSLAGPEAFVQNGTLDEGRGNVNNHFVMLPPELNATGYALAITCSEPPQDTYDAQTATARYTVWTRAEQHARTQGIRIAERARPLRIPLTIHEPTEHSRSAWPVSSGVPLPDGALTNPRHCRILDAAGKPVVAQFKALAWWPGSIHVKWLLVDFLADTRPNRDSAYTLECGVQPAEIENPIEITATGLDPEARVGLIGQPFTISTGPLSVEFEGGFAPFANVEINGRTVATPDANRCGFEITDAEGTVYSSALAPPDEVLIEDSGPVRATICIKGKLVSEGGEGYMRYLCRMHFYAGKPAVRTVFTLENDVLSPDMNLIGSLRVRVPAELPDVRLNAWADGARLHALAPGDRLLQDDDNHFSTADAEGERAEGWIQALSEERGLTVTVRDFWQLYPKGLSADESGVTIDLLPELPADQYAGASDNDINKLYFWCDTGKYKIRTGVRLTTEFAVDFIPFTPPAPSANPAARFAATDLWQSPIFAACAPEWYCSTGAFGPMVPRAPGKFDVYEKNLDEAFAELLKRRDRVREYGFMNYGDWYGERTWNWGNQEYDTQWALAVNFARTGNLDMLWRAEEAECHNADVDTTHYWPRQSDVGRVWTHCTGHTGGYFPSDWKDMGWFNRGPRTSGHTWSQGHFYMYALTGEPRYLDTGRKVADYFARITTNFRFASERSVGWPMTGLMGAYNIEPNPVYLNASKLMADTIMWTQPERGGWGHFIDGNECKHTPRCWGCKTFMTGVLLHGLKMYDLAQPRDDIKGVIRKNCEFVWRVCYVPKDNGFIYSECLDRINKGSTWTMSLIGDGLAYGCLLDPEHRHKDSLLLATSAFVHQAGVSSFGKGFTQGACFAPQMLHDLDALGLTDIPEPPPRGEDSAELRKHIFLAPGEERAARPIIHHIGAEPLGCAISFLPSRADWFDRAGDRLAWDAPAGLSMGPEITVRAPQNADPGAAQTLRARIAYGDADQKLQLTAQVVAPADLGDRIGWITGKDDPLRLAAEALGIQPDIIADASTADLTAYRAIIVGAEAFNKGFGNAREASPQLQEWVASGGRLIVGQLNDQNWEVGLLPFDLVLSDTGADSAGLVAPQHPLFNNPHRLRDLAGVVSYDSITHAAPGWKPLAMNAAGGPAILQAASGAGSVLVIMPSFDRPVAGVEDRDTDKRDTCVKLIENLLAYAGY